MPQPARLVRRVVLSVLALLALAALVPTPTARLEPGPVWSETATLGGTSPVDEDEQRGAPYSPIGLVALDVFLGLDLSGDPSGSTAVREFAFPDEMCARAAAHDAIVAGIRNGYSMQSAPLGQQVWLVRPGVWHDDGWDTSGKLHYVVTVVTPAAASEPGWRVRLLLEHSY
jgi:hypothetical protein